MVFDSYKKNLDHNSQSEQKKSNRDNESFTRIQDIHKKVKDSLDILKSLKDNAKGNEKPTPKKILNKHDAYAILYTKDKLEENSGEPYSLFTKNEFMMYNKDGSTTSKTISKDDIIKMAKDYYKKNSLFESEYNARKDKEKTIEDLNTKIKSIDEKNDKTLKIINDNLPTLYNIIKDEDTDFKSQFLPLSYYINTIKNMEVKARSHTDMHFYKEVFKTLSHMILSALNCEPTKSNLNQKQNVIDAMIKDINNISKFYNIVELSKAINDEELWDNTPSGPPQNYKFSNLPVVDSDNRSIFDSIVSN